MRKVAKATDKKILVMGLINGFCVISVVTMTKVEES